MISVFSNATDYITLSSKVCLVMAMVFPLVMYGCESWIIKKAECQRIDAFELWSKRLLISWLQSPSAVILEPPKINSVTVFTVSPSISHEVMGPDAMILVF